VELIQEKFNKLKVDKTRKRCYLSIGAVWFPVCSFKACYCADKGNHRVTDARKVTAPGYEAPVGWSAGKWADGKAY